MLTLAEMQYQREAVANILSRRSVYMDLLNPETLSIAKQQYLQQIYADIGEAVNSMSISTDEDTIALGAPKTINIPITSELIRIPWRDIAAAETEGRSLSTDAVSQAALKVADRYEQNIINGDARFALTGLANNVGAETTSGAGWNTGDSGAHAIIVAATSILDGNGARDNHAMVINPRDYRRLLHRTTATTKSQLVMIREDELLPGGIYESPFIAPGTAAVYSKVPESMTRITAGRTYVEQYNATNSNRSDTIIAVYGTNVPKIIHDRAVCRITGIPAP